jgi:hypothetical protein
MNLREKAQKLGKLQVKIYWEHDRCDFEELAQAARELYELLGYEKKEATEIGKLISVAYQLADEAERFQGIDSEKEKELYHQVERKLREIEQRLNSPISLAYEQSQWWYASRHRHWFKLIYYLFLQQWKPLKFALKRLALPLTFSLIKVGISHFHKNQLECEENASQYWYIILKNQAELNLYLG